jgi:AraC family transcriptional regulator, transcriptional activator of pobA
MNDLKRFETVNDYNLFNNNETLHPQVSVVDLSKASPRQLSRMYFGFYTIFLKDVKCGDLVYGRHTYDYQEGTLVFLAPGQVAGTNRFNTWHRSRTSYSGLYFFRLSIS